MATSTAGSTGSKPPKRGLSTGVKLALGCGAALLVGVVGLLAALGAGAIFVGQQVKGVASAVQTQAETQEVVREIERRHAFSAPAEGTVDLDRARTFVAIMEEGWQQIEPQMEALERRLERAGDGNDLRAIRDAYGSVGDLAEARTGLIRVLERHEMSPSELVWIGTRLSEARRDIEAGQERTPAHNRMIAEQYRAALDAKSSDGNEARMDLVVGFVAVLSGVVPAGTAP